MEGKDEVAFVEVPYWRFSANGLTRQTNDSASRRRRRRRGRRWAVPSMELRLDR